VRTACLILLLLLIALSSLGHVTAPSWLNWKVALVATEYGARLAVLAVVAGIVCFAAKPAFSGTAAAGIALALIAAGLLLLPCREAAEIAAGLPARFDEAFGKADATSLAAAPAAFSWSRLYAPAPDGPTPHSLRVSEGLPFDFYPAISRANAPCVVAIHGGGWDSGDEHEFRAFNHALARAGYSVAAISYRLAPEHTWPAQRDDVVAAIAWLKSHAVELRIDATRLVLFGRSAGGQLAESVGCTIGDPAIRGVIAFYAPADLEFAWQYGSEDDILNSVGLMRQYLGGTPASTPGAFRAASPFFSVGPQTPPMLLMHGQLDPLVWHKQSERLAARLRSLRVPHVFVSRPWATQPFDYPLRGPGGQLARGCVKQFVGRTTGVPPL
jgi:acetyl esterase/lipase